MSKIKHALKKFKYIFSNVDVTPYLDLPFTLNIFNRSKLYYLNLKSKKELEPKSFNRWRTDFPDFEIENLYIKKLKPLKVIKVKEFLFKILHNICPCRDILYRWKLSTTNECFYCNDGIHTIKHMLWECPFVKSFWFKIQNILNLQISYQTLICGGTDNIVNHLLSILMYFIYKKFVVDNND